MKRVALMSEQTSRVKKKNKTKQQHGKLASFSSTGEGKVFKVNL